MYHLRLNEGKGGFGILSTGSKLWDCDREKYSK